jgi:hypothetical protein
MGDHGEVCEVALNGRVQDGLGPGVAEGGPVLVQQVHQLLADVSEKKYIFITLSITFLELCYNFIKISTKCMILISTFYLDKLTW